MKKFSKHTRKSDSAESSDHLKDFSIVALTAMLSFVTGNSSAFKGDLSAVSSTKDRLKIIQELVKSKQIGMRFAQLGSTDGIGTRQDLPANPYISEGVGTDMKSGITWKDLPASSDILKALEAGEKGGVTWKDLPASSDILRVLEAGEKGGVTWEDLLKDFEVDIKGIGTQATPISFRDIASDPPEQE